MRPRNRQEVEEIFHQALQYDPAQRDAFVREACHGDSELHCEVSSLLSHHDEMAGFEPWAAAAAAQLIAAPASLQAGQLMGPYRIDAFIAAGAIGVSRFHVFAEKGGVLDIKSFHAKFTSRCVRQCGKLQPSDRFGKPVKCLRGSESCL